MGNGNCECVNGTRLIFGQPKRGGREITTHNYIQLERERVTESAHEQNGERINTHKEHTLMKVKHKFNLKKKWRR